MGIRGCFFLLCVALAGCTVIDMRNTTDFNAGRGPVAAQALAAIEPGKTRADWLVDQFGYPDTVTRDADNAEVWHYRFEQRHHNLFRILLVFQYRAAVTEQRDMYFKIMDQVVVASWGDAAKRAASVAPQTADR